MNRRTIPHAEFMALVEAQGVPREHTAVMCPICGTVQSQASLMAAGATPEQAQRLIGFSCEGRLTKAGPATNGRPAPGQRGCDWTLGGLFQLHNLEVLTEDGTRHPHFELTNPTDAQELRVDMMRKANR